MYDQIFHFITFPHCTLCHYHFSLFLFVSSCISSLFILYLSSMLSFLFHFSSFNLVACFIFYHFISRLYSILPLFRFTHQNKLISCITFHILSFLEASYIIIIFLYYHLSFPHVFQMISHIITTTSHHNSLYASLQNTYFHIISKFILFANYYVSVLILIL